MGPINKECISRFDFSSSCTTKSLCRIRCSDLGGGARGGERNGVRERDREKLDGWGGGGDGQREVLERVWGGEGGWGKRETETDSDTERQRRRVTCLRKKMERGRDGDSCWLKCFG